MPELPEVETIRRGIEPVITGKKITAVHILETRLRRPVNEGDFEKWVTGQTITGVGRRSKYLLLNMSNGATLLIHLGMSGHLGLFAPDAPLDKHTHIIFDLENNIQVRYRDPRRFGLLEVAPPGAPAEYASLAGLGPEPLSAEFNGASLAEALAKSGRAIKVALLDMRVAAGVGNIYANEALFAAGIDPRRLCRDLSAAEFDALAAAVKATLSRAIAQGGTTLNDYRNALGEAGFFQLELAVYERDKQPCLKCGAVIERVVLGGRSSYFCPCCQR
ncbi:MAG TPA: bifunctional DNA-formamidopyrimidine glycosylase/DNA-(apurinic or apyrimidinic site) lyase [bacterium]|nr:bifunctional DNA-formamidopyrimidine glycosylase/DNA-(apurinic or apyrimidinic site) lyase [bacterium]HPN43915.1 bifunctional DNA-formamidopyrimidine glycosylase/DNA-(apurinic or apyrimidinic site) lyase [bacterium]